MSRLVVRQLDAFYGDFQALFGISLDVADGETVAIIGANGSGKSTFLKAVAGALPVARTAVELDGVAVGGRPAHELVEHGVTLVPEGRRIFPSLTVEENLRIGAYRARSIACTSSSLASPSASARRGPISPAVSSRCWRSAAGSWPTRSYSSSTRSRSGWRR